MSVEIIMKKTLSTSGVAIVALVAMLSGCSPTTEISVTLSGDQEVPPVQTSASGTGKFTIKENMSLSGSVKTEDMQGTAAHIHRAPPGANGGVEITLTQRGDDEWVVPSGTTLTGTQMKALSDGELYVNVHSDAYAEGEIRGQLNN